MVVFEVALAHRSTEPLWLLSLWEHVHSSRGHCQEQSKVQTTALGATGAKMQGDKASVVTGWGQLCAFRCLMREHLPIHSTSVPGGWPQTWSQIWGLF